VLARAARFQRHDFAAPRQGGAFGSILREHDLDRASSASFLAILACPERSNWAARDPAGSACRAAVIATKRRSMELRIFEL
jgi:hypothetical protein